MATLPQNYRQKTYDILPNVQKWFVSMQLFKMKYSPEVIHMNTKKAVSITFRSMSEKQKFFIFFSEKSFFPKRFHGHEKCSFDNPAESLLPKGCKFFAEGPKIKTNLRTIVCRKWSDTQVECSFGNCSEKILPESWCFFNQCHEVLKN